MKFAGETPLGCPRVFVSPTKTSRSAFGKGRRRKRTALITLNTAVFAPIPSASVSTATAVKPGFFSSWRKANLRSLITQSLDRIDFRRAPRGHPAREQCHRRKQQRDRR